jgi:hypothetical protein
VFDETNGSQVEQVDLDEIGNEEAPCIALRNMSIGDVCPKESEEPPNAQDQPSSSTQASPPTQNEAEAQVDEVEDQANEPPQDEGNDQGGDINDQDKEDEEQRPPHQRVHQAIQRDHPIDTILGDIHKGVTTRSRVAHFCEHYSFVSSIEPHRVEEALQDSNWVVAMQEELNNFTRNEVWHLVPRPNQNVVGTKWVFRNKQDEHGVPSSMDQSRKRSMLSNLPALKIVSTLTMSINSLRRFMGSSKPQDHGMNALGIFSSLMNSKSERPILLYSLKLLKMTCLYAKFMLMILYLGILTSLHVKNLVGS